MTPLGGGRGRPVMPDDERAAAWLRLRCTPTELDSYRAAAASAGLKLSAWVRSRLTLAATASVRDAS